MPDTQTFYHLLADVYDLLFPVTEAQRRFFAELVGEHGIGRVLDVACGSGEQAALFRELGVEVSALEYDEKMVERVHAKELGIDVRLGSMENVAELFAPGYDLVLCIGNSLPHLDDLGGVERAVRGMASLLGAGGVLVLGIVNFDRVIGARITSLPTKKVVDEAGRTIVFERSYGLRRPTEHVAFSMRLTIGGTTQRASVPLLPIPARVLAKLVTDMGLRITGKYADFNRAAFTRDAASLILVARRR
jgi:glycine/sarcosine N-methyltransferase